MKQMEANSMNPISSGIKSISLVHKLNFLNEEIKSTLENI